MFECEIGCVKTKNLDWSFPFGMFESQVNDTKNCHTNGQPGCKPDVVHQLDDVGRHQVGQGHGRDDQN